MNLMGAMASALEMVVMVFRVMAVVGIGIGMSPIMVRMGDSVVVMVGFSGVVRGVAVVTGGAVVVWEVADGVGFFSVVDGVGERLSVVGASSGLEDPSPETFFVLEEPSPETPFFDFLGFFRPPFCFPATTGATTVGVSVSSASRSTLSGSALVGGRTTAC